MSSNKPNAPKKSAQQRGQGWSPFAFFRKHQATAMVILLVLVLFVFTIGDSLQTITQNGSLPPVLIYIMCMFVGVSIMWVIGMKKKRTGEFSVIGLLGGVLVALVFTKFIVPKPKDVQYTTSIGSFRASEIEELIRDRQTANFFLQALFYEAFPVEDDTPNPMGRGREADQWVQHQFNFGYTPARDVLLGKLLEKEADKMGIVISDDAINDWLNRITKEQVGDLEFGKALDKANVTQVKLFDILRNQRKSQLAAELLVPRGQATPSDYWDIYQRVHVTKNLSVANLPAREFLEQVNKPGDAELEKFFDQHKENYPRTDGTPGFRRSITASIAYLEADLDTFREKVEPPTESDILAHYEANKDQLYRQFDFPDDSQPPVTNEDTPREPLEAPRPDLKSTPEETEKPEEKTEENTTPEEKPEEKPGGPELPAPETNPEEKPAPENKEEKKEEEGANNAIPAKTVPVSLLQEEPETQTAPEAPGKPDNEKKEQTAPEAPGKPDDEKKQETTDPAVPGPELPAPTAPSRPPVEAPKPELPKPVKYKPLDDVLKDQIRDEIINIEAGEALDKAIKAAQDSMYKFSKDLEFGDDDKINNTQAVLAAMKKYAEENDLHYAKTPFLTFKELRESENHPIGRSTPPGTNQFAQNGQNNDVALATFNSPGKDFFIPELAQDSSTGNLFAWWKVEEKEPHVPKFDDKRVKEQVREAWMLAEARKLAVKRAEALAEQVRESDKSMKEALKDVTRLGTESSPTLQVAETGPVSWLREQRDQQNPFGGATITASTIPFVPDAGFDFRDVAFSKLKVGEVGVTHDAAKDVYYVVKVLHRTPVTPEGIEELRQNFMKENFFGLTPQFVNNSFQMAPSQYQQLVSQQQSSLILSFYDRLFEKYDVQELEVKQPRRRVR